MAESELEAGSELDARIAQIMEPMPGSGLIDGLGGPIASDGGWWVWNGMGWMPNKHPSTDWSAAGEVIHWLREQTADIQQEFYDGLASQWRQWCSEQETEAMTEDEWADIHLLTGTSRWFILYADIPLAICLAALKAVEKPCTST